MNEPCFQFDAAFAVNAINLACRPRDAGDSDFLRDCAIACSPMRDLLPEAMLIQQAQFQRAAHDGAYPNAMHRILTRNGKPLGHVRIAWADTSSHLIDIALMPDHQGGGVGSHALAAWLAVADARRLIATLEVRSDNPAHGLYARFGFTPLAPDPHAATITMQRMPA